jgi:branched-chain amino acid transport system ATP-binding protein
MSILEITGLRVWYGDLEAIHNINLCLNEGEITAIIGSNGAGKSTIMKAISGMVKRSGKFLFKGQKLSEKSNDIVRRGIVQVPEGRKIFAGLSVEENLLLGAYSIKNRKEIPGLLKQQFEMFPRLEERRNQDAGTLSGGEQQMLAIARALMAKPVVLMLDEPSLGLAPILVNEVFAKICQICSTGTTILLVEQNARKSLCICSKAYVLENGRIVLEDSGERLLNNEQVASAYLGGATVLSCDLVEEC